MTRGKEVGGMGFRDFLSFNLAMLDKQGWRLMNTSNDLWVIILKGIYFPNDSFLDAKKKKIESIIGMVKYSRGEEGVESWIMLEDKGWEGCKVFRYIVGSFFA